LLAQFFRKLFDEIGERQAEFLRFLILIGRGSGAAGKLDSF
jgi:hypothetical protein